MLIYKDMGVRVYIMLKKSGKEFNKYPLCISKLPSIIGTNELCGSSNQDSDTITSISINENDEFDNRQLSIGELVEPLHILWSGSCDGVISDPCNKFVEVDQVYKTKDILKSVMEKYAIEKRFQYRTVRSNAIRYLLYTYKYVIV